MERPKGAIDRRFPPCRLAVAGRLQSYSVMKTLLILVSLIVSLQGTEAFGLMTLPNDSQVLDADDYYIQCNRNNPDNSALCEEAASQYETRQESAVQTEWDREVQTDEVAQLN
jgi:uncharacterized membrane protein YcjF (UPF0283 family)